MFNLNEFSVYIDYLALKRHFTQAEYDWFRYNGKVNASISAYEKRRDRLFFAKLVKHNDPHGFLLANILNNPKVWIRDIIYSESAEQIYLSWLKQQQSLFYIFKQELNLLLDNFNDNFIIHNNQHPHIILLYLRKDISLETLCILVSLTGCLKHWIKKLDDPIFNEIVFKINKYTLFINYDREKFKGVIVEKYS